MAATPGGQASLRDHLNERVAPYLRKALIAGLNNDVEFPLQWLGEHLIHLSMLHEGNPDSTNIKAHFKYKHDAPPPPPPPEPVPAPAPAPAPVEMKDEEQPQDNAVMSNGIAGVESESEHVNGETLQETHEALAPVIAEASIEEGFPTASHAPAQEDTEMQGSA